MIKILTKIGAEITIIVLENREPYFIIICKCKEVALSIFSYQMLASTMSSLGTIRSMALGPNSFRVSEF